MLRLVLLAGLLVACSKKEDAGPPCDKVVDHMLELTKQMLPGHGDQPMGDRKVMIDQCVQRKMSASLRRCLVAAKSFEDLAKCRSDDRKATTPAPTAPSPTAPAPTAPAPTAPAPTAPAPTAPAPSTPPTPEPIPTRPLPTGSAAPGAAGSGSAGSGSSG